MTVIVIIILQTIGPYSERQREVLVTITFLIFAVAVILKLICLYALKLMALKLLINNMLDN